MESDMLEGVPAYGSNQMLEGSKLAYMPTIKDRIANAVIQAETRLAQVKRAREILDKNPELEELLNIMQSAHF